jgi:hypothetical protein
MITDLNKESKIALDIFNAKVIRKASLKKEKPFKNTITKKTSEEICSSTYVCTKYQLVFEDCPPYEVCIFDTQNECWWETVCYNDSYSFLETPLYDPYNCYDNPGTPWCKEGCNDCGDGSGGDGTEEEDDQIDTTELTDQLKCIYGKLIKNSLEFKNAILRFDGDFPISHLKFSINNNLPIDVYGKTMLPTNFVTEIQINGNSINSLSDLGKALVFAHEIIHAEIFRKMLSAAQLGTLTSDGSNMTIEQQTNYVNSLKDNFPGLYDYYFKRYKPSWNHEMMANHYRSTISDMIQNFDGNRLNKSTYDAISWLGLGKLDKNNTTIAWDTLSNDDKEVIEKLIIENIYNSPKNCN